MRIGFDVSKVVPPRDGLGTYSVELLRALFDEARDHTIRLHGLIQPFDREAAAAALPELPGHVQFADCKPAEDRLNLFHTSTLAWPVGFDGPVVMTCNDLTFLTHPECHRLEILLHCMEGMLRGVLARAHVIAISQATADQAATLFDIPPERLDVVHLAASADMQPGEPDVMQSQLAAAGVPGEFVLAVGTLEPRKNLLRLLTAHAALDSELRSRYPLVLAGGGGWKNDDLEQQLEGAEHVVRLGHVDAQLLPALYGSAAAFVYPSLAEGFGLPILEAMACGAPVITSDASCMPEVAGSVAILVDPLDTEAITAAMRRVLTDPELAAGLSARGRARAAEFSWQRTAARTLEVYRQVERQNR